MGQSFFKGNKRVVSVPRIALVTAIAAASYQMPTFAQGRDASLVLEEVIVSAQKELENLQDIASTVNIVDASSINKYKVFSIDDVSSLTAGVSFDRPDARRQTITMRGITADPDNVADQPISVYFNDLPLRPQEAFQQLYDISLIEILRGPQGTLQGRTDPAGSIHIYSQKPNTSEVDGYIQQTFSDNNGSNTQFGVSLPIIPDVLAVRVAGVYDDNEGQEIKNITTGQTEQHRTTSGRITIDWLPTDVIEASMTYQYNELGANIPQPVSGDNGGIITTMGKIAGGSSLFYGGSGGAPIPGLGVVPGLRNEIQADPIGLIVTPGITVPVPPYAGFSGDDYATALFKTIYSKDAPLPTHLADPKYVVKAGNRTAIHGGENDTNLKNEFVSLQLDFDLETYTISSITGYKEFVSDNTEDNDYGYVYAGLPQQSNTISKVRVSSQELRLAYVDGDFWEYQVGMFYAETDSTTTNVVDVTGAFNLTGAIASLEAGDAESQLTVPIEVETLAFFMHNKFNFSDSTTLQVGIRWQDYDSKRLATSQPFNNYNDPGTDIPVFDPTNGGDFFVPTYGTGDCLGIGVACNQIAVGTLAKLNTQLTNQAKFNTLVNNLADEELIKGEDQTNSADAFTGGIKLQHYLDATDHETMLYASLDRSYRPAGTSITPTPLSSENLTFDEETSNSLELGFKSTLQDGSLRINGSAYIQKYDGFQSRTESVNWVDGHGDTAAVLGGIVFNADATVTGVELEFQKALAATWRLGGGMSYTDGTFDSGTTGPCNANISQDEINAGVQIASCDISGKNVGNQPLWSGTLNSEYFIPLDAMQGSEWYIRGLVSYKGKQSNRLVEDLAISDYTLINLYTGLRSDSGDWDFSVWAKNIADTERRADIRNAYEVSFGATNYRVSSMIAPRLVGMTLRYNFGG